MPRLTTIQGFVMALVPLLAAPLVAFGCSGPPEGMSAGAQGSTGGGTQAGTGGSAPISCAKGQAEGSEGTCAPTGIQGCADVFLGDDNLCHPSMAKCQSTPGTIPKFDEGCVAVGIRSCAKELQDPDGLCHPKMATCQGKPGTFAVPQEGCVPIDGPDGCGTGAWGTIPDGAKNVYVDKSASGGGDGSKALPVNTIAAAMALVKTGGRIAVAAGVYDEAVTIVRGIELRGRCPSMVRVQGSTTADGFVMAVLVASVANVRIQGLEIGGPGIGIFATGAPGLTVDHVHILKATSAGVVASGGSTDLTISHSWIEGTLADAGTEDFGLGIDVQHGAKLTLSGSALVGNAINGIEVSYAGTELTASNDLIEGTLEHPLDHSSGEGIHVDLGAKATVSDTALVGNRHAAMEARDAASSLAASHDLLEGTLTGGGNGAVASGLLVAAGAQASLEGNAVVANRDLGVLVDGVNTVATLTGDLIQGTLPTATTNLQGNGVIILRGAHATLTSVAVVANHGVGVGVTTPGSVGTIIGSLIEGTLPQASDQEFGKGLEVSAGAEGHLLGSAIVANHQVGVHAGDEGSTLEATNDLLEGTLPEVSDERFGRGMEVDFGAAAMVDACVITGNRSTGLFVIDSKSKVPTDVHVTGSLIQNTLPRQSDGGFGVGIYCEDAHLTLETSVLRSNNVAAVLMVGTTIATISRTFVDGVPGGKFTLINPTETFSDVGDGILALEGASVTVTDTRIQGAIRAGLLFDQSKGSIRTTVSKGNRFGLVLQGKLQPDVGLDNDFSGNSDKSTFPDGDLPVPNASSPIP